MTDRKLVLYAEIPLPADMAEAGRIQIAWAEQVKAFNAALADGVGKLDLRVASSRPRGTRKETEPKGPALPPPVGQQEPGQDPQKNGAEQAQLQTGVGGAAVPPWAQR